jgi:hypothetical protein
MHWSTKEANINVVLENRGMTLRDYFAAKALESILYMDRGSGIIGVNNHEHYCAKDAYRVADAMLKAREA